MSATSPGTLTAVEELELGLTGMTCAACAARIEKRLNEIDGVEAAVNYATESAMVAFQPSEVSAQSLIEAVRGIGYDAQVLDDEPYDDGLDERLAALRLRLTVAAVFSVPVVVLSMVPAAQFTNWQWWAGALSAPVVTWAEWAEWVEWACPA